MPQPQPKLVELQTLDDTLLTSYIRRMSGRTRQLNGSLPPERLLVRVNRHILLSPAAAKAYVALAAAVVEAGGAPLRLTEAYRSQDTQADARRKYEAWRDAGRPEPGTRGFIPARHKAAYVAPPGRSNHGWGGAVDLDVGALEFPDAARNTDEALEKLWELAEADGWYPVITRPVIDQAEAWHFDFRGVDKEHPVSAVRSMFRDHDRGVRSYGDAAVVGSVLLSTYRDLRGTGMHRYAQARLNIGGFYAGAVDGVFGRLTRAACKKAEVTFSKDPSKLINRLDEKKIGWAAMERL